MVPPDSSLEVPQNVLAEAEVQLRRASLQLMVNENREPQWEEVAKTYQGQPISHDFNRTRPDGRHYRVDGPNRPSYFLSESSAYESDMPYAS